MISRRTPIKTKDDIQDLFDQTSEDIGLDNSSSSIIVANLNATTLPMCIGPSPDSFETDDRIILFYIVDQSPSMTPVESEVINGFNDILIPAFKGASKDVVDSYEIGGIAFNENVTPLWGGGFFNIHDLPILTKADYDTNSGYGTALYKAVLDGLTAVSVRSAEIINETGSVPKVIVVIISDGANNQPPVNPDNVKKVADDLSNEIFVKGFAGFETGETVDFHDIADQIGFGKPFEMKQQPGESKDDMQRRIRHLFGTLSSSTIKQSATTVGSGSSNTFWVT